MIAQAYPLTWPPGFPRTKFREKGQFRMELSTALNKVQDSLRRFGSDSNKPVTGLVISSNYSLGVNNPTDPGVSVWFTWDSIQVCIPVDRYQTVAANLAAIHHVIEARRTELRHGTLALVRATFTGFAALPAPGPNWRDVLMLAHDERSLEDAERAFKQLARHAHPDNGGSHEKMAALNAAMTAARQELNRE